MVYTRSMIDSNSVCLRQALLKTTHIDRVLVILSEFNNQKSENSKLQ